MDLYSMQRGQHRRGRSYSSYGMQDKFTSFMRPVPYEKTKEGWFLRPNLDAKGYEAEMQAPT